MKTFTTFLLFLSFVAFTNCNGEPQTRTETHVNEHGNTLTTPYVNGKKHGTETYTSKNGALLSQTEYAEGRKKSQKFWGPKGRVESGSFDEKEKRHGVWTWKSADGQLLRKETFRAGNWHGAYESYHENGKLSLKGQYTDGKKDGVWVYTHDTGTPYRKQTFKMGELLKTEDL